jgi:hypothetical protein
MEEIMLSAKCLWLLPIAALSFPVCTQAVALNQQAEPANILTSKNAADPDQQKVDPKGGYEVIAIILQNNRTGMIRQSGTSNHTPRSEIKSAKPRGSGPGRQFLNPQPEPPNHSGDRNR